MKFEMTFSEETECALRFGLPVTRKISPIAFEADQTALIPERQTKRIMQKVPRAVGAREPATLRRGEILSPVAHPLSRVKIFQPVGKVGYPRKNPSGNNFRYGYA
jgi:hypothetical protein